MFFASPTTRSGRLQESENLLVPAALPTTGPFSPSDGMGYQHAVAAAAAARNSELEVHGALLQHLYPTGNDVCSLSTNGLLLPADPNCSSSSPSNSTSSPPKLSALGPPPPPEQHPQFWDQTHSAKRESLEHRFVQCQQHVPLPPSQTLLFHDHCSTEMLGSVAMLTPTMSQQLIADFPMQQQPQEVSHGSEPVEEGRCNEDSRVDNQTHQWDIKDVRLPNVTTFEPYDLWPNGSCRRVYSFTSERARRHQSGWAMRNTNNHNPHVLKKSCLGVLVCSSGCYMNGQPVAYRPAICDKARKKQCMRACINPGCEGHLVQRHCKGHGGYPVTHFWRFSNNAVFFQAKGEHDHVRPMLKAFGERETRAPRASAGRANSSALHPDSCSSEPGATDATIVAVATAAAAAAGSGKRGKRKQCPAEEPHELNILAPMRVVRTSSNFGGKSASSTVKGIKEKRKRGRTIRNGSLGLLPEPAKFLSEPGPQSPSLLSARESFLFSNQSAVPALPEFQLPTDTAPFFNSLPEDLNQYHHQYQHTPACSSPSVPPLPLKTEMSSWMSPLSFLPPAAPTPPERHTLILPTFEYPFAEGEISRYMAQHETFSQAPATSAMEYSTAAAAAAAFQAADAVFRQEPPPQPQYHGGNWMIKTEASSAFENFSDHSFPQWELLQQQQQQHPQLNDAVNREMTTTANGTDSCSPSKLSQHPGDEGNSFAFFQSAAESSLSTANYTQAQISPYGGEVQSTDASDGGPAQHPALRTSLVNFHLRQELEQPFLGMLLSLDQGNRQQQSIGMPPGQHLSPGLSVDCADETATSTDVSGTGLPMGESLGSDGEEGDGGGCRLGTSQQGYWKGQQLTQEGQGEVKSLRLPSMEQVSQATCQPVHGDLRTDWFSRSTTWKTVGSS